MAPSIYRGDFPCDPTLGCGQVLGEGSFVTLFAGDHDWFWHNCDDAGVTVVVQSHGDYAAIVRDK